LMTQEIALSEAIDMAPKLVLGRIRGRLCVRMAPVA
jgi:hypothetical protein